MCELNRQKASGSLSLADDVDFIYVDIPGVVSVTNLLSFHKIKIHCIHVSKLDKMFKRDVAKMQWTYSKYY
jgi:hypothetical protein